MKQTRNKNKHFHAAVKEKTKTTGKMRRQEKHNNTLFVSFKQQA
jgi:hypothetical protein